VGGDDNVASEVRAVMACAESGRLRRVPFDEGANHREKGTFLLAIIEGGAAATSTDKKDSERRAVVTMAIGPDFDELAALSIPGQSAYARRLDADHLVLRRPVVRASSPFYEIFQIHRLFETYSRILYLDLDVLVRDDCPDLFALVPPASLGAFVESRLVDRSTEISHVQSLWPSLGWTDDYFNNGVLVAGRAHRELFAPSSDLPRDLRFADQTVMNYRAAAAGFPLHDLGFGLNYMPALLARGPLLRFLLNHIGHDLVLVPGLYLAFPEPENAQVLHCAGLPHWLKLRLARRTLARWAEGRSRAFSAGHRHLNRVFGGLVPQPAPDAVLESGDARPRLRHPSGKTRLLDDLELALWRGCDGRQTTAQLARAIRAIAPGLPVDTGRQAVHRGLHELLAAGFLTAVNQSQPPLTE
jgi:hypothetical protein